MQSGSSVLRFSGLNHTDLRCLIPSDQRPLLARMPTKGGLFFFCHSSLPSSFFSLLWRCPHLIPQWASHWGVMLELVLPILPNLLFSSELPVLQMDTPLLLGSAFQGVSILSKDAQPVLGWLWLLMKSSVSLPWDRMQELKVHKIQCPLLGSQEGRDPRGQQLGRWCVSLESSLVVSNLIFLSLHQLLIL